LLLYYNTFLGFLKELFAETNKNGGLLCKKKGLYLKKNYGYTIIKTEKPCKKGERILCRY